MPNQRGRPKKSLLTYSKVGTQRNSTEDAVDKAGTEAEDAQVENLVESLWDLTITSYPAEMIVKLPYYHDGNHNVPANTIAAAHQFKVNSIFDFDLTGAGHQPLGRDTWASIYEYYKVLETRIYVTVISHSDRTSGRNAPFSTFVTLDDQGNTAMQSTFHGGMLDITSTPPATITEWKEAAKVDGNNQEIFGPIQNISPNVGRRIEYNMKWTPDLFENVILNQSAIDAWTPVGSDPDAGALNYFSHIVWNPNPATASYPAEFHYKLIVETEFLVAFTQLKRSLLHTTN